MALRLVGGRHERRAVSVERPRHAAAEHAARVQLLVDARVILEREAHACKSVIHVDAGCIVVILRAAIYTEVDNMKPERMMYNALVQIRNENVLHKE